MITTKPLKTFDIMGLQLENFLYIEVPIFLGSEKAIIRYDNGQTKLSIPDDPQNKEKAINVASSIVTSFRLQKKGRIGYELPDEYGLPYKQPKEDNKTPPMTIDNENEKLAITERVDHIKEIIENRDKAEPYLQLALRRFNRSYNDEHMEDILIDLMICFEILFVKGLDEPIKKSTCLKERVGPFLKDEGLIEQADEPGVKGDLEKAYWLRNCVVHEGKQYNLVFKRYSGDPWDFLLTIREYARTAIRGFIKCVMGGQNTNTKDIKDKICAKWCPSQPARKRAKNPPVPCP